MPNRPLNLDQDYTIDTPENVSFSYDIAGIGNRFIGALIDSFIVTCLLVFLNVLLFAVLYRDNADFASLLEGEDPGWLGGFAIALFALFQFIIFWGYYTLFEFLWNGQTPGKRLVKIRVLRLDVNPAAPECGRTPRRTWPEWHPDASREPLPATRPGRRCPLPPGDRNAGSIA